MKNLGLVQKFFSEQMERSAGGGGGCELTWYKQFDYLIRSARSTPRRDIRWAPNV